MKLGDCEAASVLRLPYQGLAVKLYVKIDLKMFNFFHFAYVLYVYQATLLCCVSGSKKICWHCAQSNLKQRTDRICVTYEIGIDINNWKDL